MKKELQERVSNNLWQSINAKKIFWEKSQNEFFEVANELHLCVQNKGKILIFGNGGSACDAMHFVGELVNRYRLNRPPMAAVALTADAPLISCIANDFSFDFIFEKQVQALGRPEDVVIGISTSGNSPNVLLGLKAARALGARTVALTGGAGGKIVSENLADHVLCVDHTKDVPRIQECHEWILHELADLVETLTFGEEI